MQQLLSSTNVVAELPYVAGIQGGRTAGRPITKKIISWTANLVAKSIVSLRLNYFASSFRCHSTRFIKEAFASLQSQTYEIQINVVEQALSRGFSFKEIPILSVNWQRWK